MKINYIILATILLIAAITDYRTRIIPNRLILGGLIIGLILPFLTNNLSFHEAFKGLLFIGSLMLLFWIIARGNFGGGDMKLCALIGLYLGWLHGLEVIFISNLLTLLLIPIFLVKKIPLRSKFPLAPFYLLGFLLTYRLYIS